MQKNYTISVLLFFVSFLCFAQINFEKGYYVTNNNTEIACYIKNVAWRNNPRAFEIKLNISDEPKEISITDAKEFGVYDKFKFVRELVKIDRSSDQYVNMTHLRRPNFTEEVLFLKVLIEGSANLYIFSDEHIKKYFYKTASTPLEQLIFKYYKADNNKIAKNERYKNQLWKNLKCDDISINTINNLSYDRSKLTKLFDLYNDCKNSSSTSYVRKEKKDLFDLTIRPGISSSYFTLTRSNNQFFPIYPEKMKIAGKIGFRAGIELEFIMPFNRSKWSFIIEPSYRKFSGEKNIKYRLNGQTEASQTIKIDYSALDINLGARHYFFLNSESKLFLNGSVVINISNGNSLVKFEKSTADLELKDSFSAAFGLGYKRNRYMFELRYDIKESLGHLDRWSLTNTALSAIIGYSLF